MKSFEIPMVVESLVGLGLLAGLAVPVAYADFTFGQAVDLGPTINSPGLNCGPCPAPDGKQLYFTRWTGVADNEIWVSRRATVDGAWGPPTRLGPPLDTNMDEVPSFTADGVSLYFDGWREGGSGGMDLWMTTSTTPYGDWGAPVNLGPAVNSDADEWSACISADGLELYFSSTRKEGFGSFDLWMTTRATAADAWGPAVHLDAPFNTPQDDCWPGLSSDGRVLFFTSSRPGGFGEWDLYMTRRASRNDPWGAPTDLGPNVNIRAEGQGGPKVSFDGSMLYFYAVISTGEAMQLDIFQSPILPTVDFNADGKVDLSDLRLLVDNWGTDKTLFDIGPFAWGDGKVDIQDLKAFIAEWEKQNPTKSDDGN
jgi:hypothetical protein